jgi:hypothetical protein
MAIRLRSAALIAGTVVPSLVLFPLSAVAKSYKWKCDYSQVASPEGTRRAERFHLEFAFDGITGKAVMIANNGISDVDIHIGSNGVTFMEKLSGGVFKPQQ